MPRFVNYRLVGSSTTTLASGDPPFTISGLAAGNYEVNDGLAWRGPFTVTASGGGTPTPTPAPTFTSQPSVSPSSGTAGTTTFTATPGTVSNGSISSRNWLLNGTSISTGTTAAPTQSGTLTYQEFASGAGGTAQSAIQSVTVAAGGGTPTPTPSASVNDTFDDTDGTLLTAHTPNTGGPWLLQPNTTVTSGSEARLTSGRLYFPAPAAYQVGPALAAAQQVEAEIVILTEPSGNGVGAYIGPCVRMSASGATFYTTRHRVVGGGTANVGAWEILAFVDGQASRVVGLFPTTTFPSAGTKTLVLNVTNSSDNSSVIFDATVEGASIGQVTDTNAARILTGGAVGGRVSYAASYTSTATTGVAFGRITARAL